MLTVLAFVVGMGSLIAFHEFGHFAVARLCGVRVLRFSIGFGRPIYRWQRDPNATEFVLCLLPLGGYVRMLDERDGAVGPDDLSRTFNRKPLAQRAAIVAAGPAANALLAVLLYAAVQWIGVLTYAPIIGAPLPGSVAAQAGLAAQDHIRTVKVGGGESQTINAFSELGWAAAAALSSGETLTLGVSAKENGIPRERVLRLDRLLSDTGATTPLARVGIVAPYMRPVLGELLPDGAAVSAGLRTGDLVLAINDRRISDAQQLRLAIQAAVVQRADGRWDAQSDDWLVDRGGRALTLSVTPALVANPANGSVLPYTGRIGAYIGEAPTGVLRQSGLWEGLDLGARKAWQTATMSVATIGQLLVGDASIKQLSGPVAIAGVAGQTANLGLAPYLSFLALLSVSLAILNLLPIPVLDGGHLMYYLWEAAVGKPVSDAWLVRFQRAGLFALLMLMVIALSNDIARLMG